MVTLMGCTRLVLLLMLQFALYASIPVQFEILSAQRTIDASSHLTRITTKIVVENIDSKPANDFYIAIEPRFAEHLSFVSFMKEGAEEEYYPITELNSEMYVTAHLEKPVASKTTAKFVVYEVYRELLRPHPKEIKQADSQLVITTQNANIYSPYKVKTQTTSIKLSSPKITSYTKMDPYHINDKEIEYGPFENVVAYSVNDVTVHYENNKPFLTITDLLRWVEVSHWGGNIAIEESVKIKHSGAKLQGSFSRFDYMYLRSYDNIPSVKSYKTVLPAGSKDVYYRDEIGNISTSHMLELLDSVELEIRPRYPLFGGWETHYVLGYNLPSFQYLFHRGSDFALKMRFVDHVFDDMSVDKMTLKIVLPEGASDINVRVPYSYTREDDSLHFTFLDFTGRPVVTLTKSNLVEDHIQEFELRYRFNAVYLLREPLLIIVGLMVLFLSVILFVRMDFSISIDTQAESKMRVSGAVEQVLASQNKRESLYRKLEEAASTFRKTKNSDQLNGTRKNIEGELKELRSSVEQLAKTIKDDNSDVTDKISEIQRLEGVYLGHLGESITNASRVVGASITQEAFKRNEESIEQKKVDVRSKINNLLGKL